MNERASQGICQAQLGLKAGPPETCLGHRKGFFLLSYIISMEVALTWSFQLQPEGRGKGAHTHSCSFPHPLHRSRAASVATDSEEEKRSL